METGHNNPLMVFNEHQQYACQDCPAKCCRFPWKITLSQAEVDMYRSTPWIKERLVKEKVEFLPKGDGYELPRVFKADGDAGCVFLDEDRLCAIQKQMGHEALPRTCQVYPFGFVAKSQPSIEPTIYPNVSFFCKSILYNYGESIGGKLSAKYQQEANKGLVSILPDSMLLGPIPIAKPAYLHLSDHIQSLFEREDMPLAILLLSAMRLLRQLLLMCASQSEIECADVEKAIAAFEDPHSLPAEQANGFTGRVLIAMALSYLTLDSLYKSDGKVYGGVAEVPVSYKLKYVSLLLQLIQEKGEVRFWDFPKPVNLQAAKRVVINEEDPAFQQELKRFYSHLFQSKILFAQGKDLLSILFSLASNYASTLRLTRYNAYAHGREAARLEDLREAIGGNAFNIQHKAQMKTFFQKIEQMILDQLAVREDAFERVLVCESFSVDP